MSEGPLDTANIERVELRFAERTVGSVMMATVFFVEMQRCNSLPRCQIVIFYPHSWLPQKLGRLCIRQKNNHSTVYTTGTEKFK